MKIEEPRPMKEIHQIRIKLWEEEKNLTPEERVKKSNKLLEQFVKKYHLEDRVVSLTKQK